MKQEDIKSMLELPVPFEDLKNSRVLITGANGLIGSYLCKTLDALNQLFQWNINIAALVRSPEKGEALREQLTEKNLFHVMIGDVTEPVKTEMSFDYIIHTACPTAGAFFTQHPVETISTIVEGTKNLLFLAKAQDVRSFVYVSSMEVYGEVTEEKLLSEDCLGGLALSNLRNCYPEGKRMAEQLCLAMMSEYQVPAKVIRLAQTFGPGVSKTENRVYAQFLRSSVKGEDIVLHTEGKSKRMYLDTMDAISAILTVLVAGQDGAVYNAANRTTYCSIREMAEQTVAFFNSKSKVIVDAEKNIGQYPPDNMLKLDTSRLEALGWEARFSLEQMYKRMAEEI